MSNPPETIQNGKSSLENIDLKNLAKSVKDKCDELNINLFYQEKEGKAIYNMNSVNYYLSNLKFKDIVSYGVPVVALQIFFESKGIDIGKIDGINGPQFRAGIKKYQIQHRLTPTGRINQETWTHIQNEITDESTVQETRNKQEERKHEDDRLVQKDEQVYQNNEGDESRGYSQGIKELYGWYMENQDQSELYLNIDPHKKPQNLAIPSGELTKQVTVEEIKVDNNDDDNYQLTLKDSTGATYETTGKEVAQCIQGFTTKSNTDNMPVFTGFNTKSTHYDHKENFEDIYDIN